MHLRRSRRWLIAILTILGVAACRVDDHDDGPPARSSDPSILLVGADGIPTHVRGDLGRVTLDGVTPDGGAALETIAPIFRLPPDQLYLVSARSDELGHRRMRYQQQAAGLDVVGGVLDLHVDRDGVIFLAIGGARGIDVAAMPSLDVASARAVIAASPLYHGTASGAARLVYVIATRDGRPYLAWEIVVEGARDRDPVRDLVYVDAHGGAIVEVHPTIHTARNRATYNLDHGTSLPGQLARSEGSGPVADVDVNFAHDHAGDFYDCYLALFDRDSYNGAGAQIESSVHYGVNYVNALWNGTQVVYGDGDGSTAGPLDRAFDVVAHELTHAVTDHESDLVFSNESGALNESNSDIFAAICESWKDGTVGADTWLVGEDMWTPGIPGDAFRYMSNPTQDGTSRDFYPERYTGTADNGGVHWNSGIPNLAFYLAVSGGVHPRGMTPVTVTGIGIERPAQVWYRAATTYYGPITSMAGARWATLQAAEDLYPTDPAVKRAIGDAWSAVGVPVPTEAPATIIVANGQAVSGFSGPESRTFALDVPAGATNVVFRVSTDGGDVDAYGRFGADMLGEWVTPSTVEAVAEQPELTTPFEDDSISIETGGRVGMYYLKVKPYGGYVNLTVEARHGALGIPLTDALSRIGIGGAWKSKARFAITVPAAMNRLELATRGGPGNANLYVSTGTMPDIGSGQFYRRSASLDNTDTILVKGVGVPGTWNVLVYGKAAYSGTTLTAHYWTERTWSNLAGVAGSKTRRAFVVPPGSSTLTISLAGLPDTTGEADLYIRFAAAPTLTVWDYRPLLDGNAETVTIASPPPGTYHLMVHARTAYTGVNLTASTR